MRARFLLLSAAFVWTTTVAHAQDADSAATEPGTGVSEPVTDEAADNHRHRRVVMLEIGFAEGVQEPLRERLAANLLAALDRQHLDVVQPETVAEALEPLGRSLSHSCRAGRCVGWILEVLNGDAGLVATIDAVENSYSVTLRLLGPHGDEIGHAEQRCDICTFDELAESVAMLARRLARQVPRRVDAGRVNVFPSRARARVAVDGVLVGQGSVNVAVPVGTHTIEARLEGFRTATEEVTVDADVPARVELRLAPGSDPSPPRRGRDPSLWLLTATAVGVAAMFTGALLVGVEDPHASGLDDPVFTASISLLAGGVGVSIAGGVALVIMAVSAHRDSDRYGLDGSE